MLILFLLLLTVFVFIQMLRIGEIISSAQQSDLERNVQYNNLNERIDSLREHIRNTEKAVYRLCDERSKEWDTIRTDPLHGAKLDALQKELDAILDITYKTYQNFVEPPKKRLPRARKTKS